ncbi:MAG: hypothetical protein ABR549_12320, partial [Mycobacteriales bacterium]
MIPTKVLEVELSAPAVDHPVPDHSTAKVLVRLHGTPLGFLDLPVTEGCVRAADIESATSVELALAAHLSADGISDPRAAGSDWACQAWGPQLPPDGLSVVLCTRDRADSLRVALRSVLAAGGADLEVVVV